MPPAIQPIAFVDEGLGNSSYILDVGDGRALVIDASRDPTPYLAVLEKRRLSPAFAVETHLHADFVSGSRELASYGAQVLASAAGHLEFPHRGLDHGEEVDLGGLTLRALATPGHTPEHLSYLLLDGGNPLALFSGGSLMVGTVARTDLITPERTEDLARALWRSLWRDVLNLPDDLPVYPTHGAGSFCSSPAGSARTTTIGREKTTNLLLSARNEDEFVRLLFEGLGSYPSYFLRLREVNRRGAKLFGIEQPPLKGLSVDEARRLLDDGAQLVDARPIGAFAAAHIPGALSIELRPAFASWLGWLADLERPIVFVLGQDQDRRDLVRQALKIGYERLAGELNGGVAAWQAAGWPVNRFDVVPAAHPAGSVLDVRQDDEYEAGHVPSALHAELGSLNAVEIPSGPLTVMCAHGQRAMTGASLLAARGYRDLSVAFGGPRDWARAHGQPLTTES